jgi:hypothetical protein
LKAIPNLAGLSLADMAEVIRTAVTGGCAVDFTRHAEIRMSERNVTRVDVFEVLVNGTVRKAEPADRGFRATMQHKVGGRALNVAVAFNIRRDGVVVITVFWKKKVTK